MKLYGFKNTVGWKSNTDGKYGVGPFFVQSKAEADKWFHNNQWEEDGYEIIEVEVSEVGKVVHTPPPPEVKQKGWFF